MKINSQEMLLMNKKVLKNNGEQPKPSTIKEPIQNPEETMKAFQAVGQNNMAFQGVNSVKVSKSLKTLLVAAAGALALSSCEKFVPPTPYPPYVIAPGSDSTVINVNTNQETNVNVTVDMSAITAMWQDMQASWEEMVKQNKLMYEEMVALNAKVAEFISAYQQNQMTANEFYANMYKLMLENNAYQKSIETQLVASGMTLEEATKFLSEISTRVKEGNLSAAEAYEMIIEQLGRINIKLDKMIDNQYKAYFAYTQAERAELGLLGGIFKNGQITNAQLKELNESNKYSNQKLDMLVANTDSLLAIASDTTYYNKLVEAIQNNDLSEEDFAKFEQMFNMNIHEIVKGNRETFLEAVKHFEKTVVKLAKEAQHAREELIRKMNVVAKFTGIITKEMIDGFNDLEDLLEGLGDSVEENTEIIGGKIDNLNTKADSAIVVLNNILDVASDAAEKAQKNHEGMMDAVDGAKGYLSGISTDLKETIKNQKADAEVQARIEQNTKDLNNQLNTAVAYLARLKNDVADIKNSIKGVGPDADLGELMDYVKVRDERLFNFLNSLNLDGLFESVNNIEDLVASLDDKVGKYTDYTNLLKDILSALKQGNAKLGDIDWTLQENQDKLDAIIEKMDTVCDCECGKDTPNEDIVEDLEGIFG
ncbi:hypothetical protein IJD34_03480 [bacterium]|nr:hypothetical protein [bacterium]